MEFDDAPLAMWFNLKKQSIQKKKHSKARPKEPPKPAAANLSPANANPSPEIAFDYSVENHFKAIDRIRKLCGNFNSLDANQPEIKRFSNSISFLREWRDFKYAPRKVKFANQHNSKDKDVVGEVTLNQFSAKSVPKNEMGDENEAGSNDFVMCVGGSVWALDWCPRADGSSENQINAEFVAIAAHPPESSYHKIGAPLIGRGAIQIWCLLTLYEKDDVPVNKTKKPTGRPRKHPLPDPVSPRPIKRRIGRPRKKPLDDSVKRIDNDDLYVQPLAVEYPTTSDGLSANSLDHVYTDDTNILESNIPKGKWNKAKGRKNGQVQDNGLHILRQCENGESTSALNSPLASANISVDSPSPNNNFACVNECAPSICQKSIPIDVELPRLMMCLAHNGKVAWDVKWRPVNAHRPKSMHAMGYLAVLLGNGVLEVWEVPLPHTVKLVYPSQNLIDPRFIKLKPVFRSSKLMCGDKQSIPLTVEWSVSSSNDMILAGCHDGVVALWKFSVTDSLTETRPLLSFSAETDPIRTLAWAPTQSDLECANVFAASGHKGLKFWDIRDPFRPLRDHPIQGNIYGLEWMPHLRSIFGVNDDGTLWWLKLGKAGHDIPVTGKSLAATTKSSLSIMQCSPFMTWSLQASKLTGLVAYCGEDGKTFFFQPTRQSVKDVRNRVCHYLCGSMVEEGGDVVVVSPSSEFSERVPVLKLSRAAPKEGKKDDFEELGNDGIEVFPPKVVAMHRVRWNGNRGSGRWLCYGGAAGVVRCQKVDFSMFK